MTTYDLMIKTNHYLIKGGTLTIAQKQNIAAKFLFAQSTPEQAKCFYKSVKFPNNIDGNGRRMYPVYFIPPYNDGKKYKTVMTVTPKTHILSANSYELEIIRLLYILAPENIVVKEIVLNTLERLKTTCFGNEDDNIGECFETSLIVLRFLAATAPNETSWIKERVDNFHNHFGEKHRHWGVKWYFWLCLSELPSVIAKPEILRYKNEILSQLNRSCVMNSEFDRTTHPMIICMIRNVMARLPEYEYIKDREPFVSEKDNRLHFNMSYSK